MKAGSGWEELVEGELRRNKVGLINKTEPCPRIIRSLGGGKFEVRFSEGGVLDFVGVLDGRYVELDAKDIKGRRLTFSRYFKKTQISRMRELLLNRAITGAVVRFRTSGGARGDVIYAIPGEMILTFIDGGKKSLTIDDCCEDPYCLRVEYCRWGEFRGWLEKLGVM